MSSIGNKAIMAKNLKYYIEKSGKDRRELAEIWGFPYSTVSEWLTGRKYPRIDRIEIMADYFGILKSDLIEDQSESHSLNNKDTSPHVDVSDPRETELLSIFRTLNNDGKEAVLQNARICQGNPSLQREAQYESAT